MKDTQKKTVIRLVALSLFAIFFFPHSGHAISLTETLPRLKEIANIRYTQETSKPKVLATIAWHIPVPKMNMLGSAISAYGNFTGSYDTKVRSLINNAADKLVSVKSETTQAHQETKWPEENLQKVAQSYPVVYQETTAAILPVIKNLTEPKSTKTPAPQIPKTQPVPVVVSVAPRPTTVSQTVLDGLTTDLQNLRALVLTLPRVSIVVPKDSTVAFVPPVINSGNIIFSGNTISTSTGGITIDTSSGAVSIPDNISFGGTVTINSVSYTWPSSNGSSGQVLQNNGSGGLTWATATGGGGVEIEKSGVLVQAAASIISFDDAHFNMTASSSTEVLVGLDWITGPASRSIAQTISGLWTFTGGATFSAPFELSSTASIGGNITTKGTITQTVTTGSNSFSGSINGSLGIHAVQITASGLITGTNQLSITGTGSNSFAGSLNLSKGLVGTVGVFSGTGSSSFAGSINASKGIHALDVGITGRFLSTGTGSNSFAGSLELSKGLRVNAITSATAASNSFAGSINAALGIHAVQLTASGLITGTNQLSITGTGSNSFAGSLDLTKGLRTTNLTGTALTIGAFTLTGNVAGNTKDVTNIKHFSIGTSTVNNLFNLIDAYPGSTATASFSIRANNLTVGTVASISATALTSGRVFDITVAASASGNRFGANILRVTSGAVVTASLSAGGTLAIRGAIFTHGGGVATCTGSNTPTSGCIDYAEDMPTDDLSMNAGDLVSLNSDDEEGDFKVVKSHKAYDTDILGVVSTQPAIVIGKSVRFGLMALEAETGVVPIALAGRVPVKISYENGNIKKGDYLTSGLKPGYAAKAVHKGRVIGIALESATLSSGKETVMIYLNSHYIPDGIHVDNGAVVDTSIPEGDVTESSGSTFSISQIITSVTDYLREAVLQVKKLVADNIETNTIKTHSGVTTLDQQTGEAYCIFVSGGQLMTTKGECASTTPISSAPPASPPAPESSPSPTPPIEDVSPAPVVVQEEPSPPAPAEPTTEITP